MASKQNGLALLRAALSPKNFKHKVNNKLRGAYGETDLDKKVISVNKKKHKSMRTARITPNKDGTENMLTTMVHENIHASHPKMLEKTVRKLEKKAKKLSKKLKKKVYNQFA